MTQDHGSNEQCGGGCMPPSLPKTLGIPVRINGHGPFLMSVDTGAGHTAISPKLAEQLGLEKVGEKEGHGAGGAVTLDLFGIETIEAGGKRVMLSTVGVAGFVQDMCGSNFEGSLGYDVLQHGTLTADFANESMQFGPSAETPIDGVPFEITSDGQPLVVVETAINGKGPYRFVVDTGATGTCIAPSLADELGVERGQDIHVKGVGGSLDGYFAAAPLEFSIGGLYRGSAAPVVLDIFDARSGSKCTGDVGIIGQDIMRDYVVTFDYPHRVIRFQ